MTLKDLVLTKETFNILNELLDKFKVCFEEINEEYNYRQTDEFFKDMIINNDYYFNEKGEIENEE